MTVPSTEYAPYHFPVSVKGVISLGGETVLLKNERDEWELPGGKLELGETPEQCVVREIEEELGLVVGIDRLLDVWVYTIRPERIVLIVTYSVTAASLEGLVCSNEHKECRVFPLAEISQLNMPSGYKHSILGDSDLNVPGSK